jgi:hypothetical protein
MRIFVLVSEYLSQRSEAFGKKKVSLVSLLSTTPKLNPQGLIINALGKKNPHGLI